MSKIVGLHVQNFGVGNYGFDQSLLDKSPLVSQRALTPMLVFICIKLILDKCSKSLNLELNQVLSKFKDPNWQNDEKKSKIIDDCIKVSCDIIIADYQNRLEHPDFIHRNWLRQISTLERLQNKLLTQQFLIEKIITHFS